MSRLYKKIISTIDPFVPNSFLPLWNHPIGPKTIFFWGPLGKSTLVVAGLGDLDRPPETISVRQCTSLGITGLIWARWCTVIIPKNYPLCCINIFVTLTNFYQALVAASLDAYTRPLDKVSVTQSASLSATGLIWTRYCLVIIPINYSLALCNFMLGLANGVQTVRAYRYQSQRGMI